MLYDIGFFLFSLFYLPALIFRGKLHREFGERFGAYSEAKLSALKAARDVVWVQAVSVGEVALCGKLIPALREAFPSSTVVLSTITKTVNELANKLFSKEAVVIYFPLDFSFVVKRVVSLIRPKIYVMVETEIWPNLLKELSSGSVPAIMINGRISDRSFGKYMAVKILMRRTLERIRLFCMQSEADAGRIKAIGAPAGRVRVTGTMKFDFEPKARRDDSFRIDGFFGIPAGDELFVAGSTHPGEDTAVVSSYKELAAEFPKLRLLIAPRHIERSPEVEKVVRHFGFTPVRFSSGAHQPGYGGAGAVYILDRIGYLNDAYFSATVVFVGGSLVPHGGQNPIEPAAFGKPVIFGPHMFNFKAVASVFSERDAAVQIKDGNELFAAVRRLLKEKGRAVTLGINAKTAVLDNRGATGRNVAAIREVLI